MIEMEATIPSGISRIYGGKTLCVGDHVRHVNDFTGVIVCFRNDDIVGVVVDQAWRGIHDLASGGLDVEPEDYYCPPKRGYWASPEYLEVI